MLTVSLDGITEAIGNEIDGTEAVSVPLNPLDQGVDVLPKLTDPLTDAIRTAANLVEAGFNKVQSLLYISNVLFEHRKVPAKATGIVVNDV